MKQVRLLVALFFVFPLSARAADDAFFETSPLRLIVGNGSGAGYDAYARLYSRHVAKHLKGKPNVIVLNRPGAGSLVMMNELYAVAPRDGSTLGFPLRNALTAELLGESNAKFDVNQMNWIGSLNDEVGVCGVWHTHPAVQLGNLREMEAAIGATGINDDTAVFPNILNRVLGTKLRVVTGYTSGAEVNLAMERGEIQGRCMSYSQLTGPNVSWLKESKFRILVQLTLQRHQDLPKVPIITEVADEAYTSALKLVFARQLWGRPLVAPPGLPTERVLMHRAAFDATMKDPGFLSDAEKAKLEINPIDGKQIQSLVSELNAYPQKVIATARGISK